MIDTTDRLYLQPTAFVDRPHGLDGRVHRLRDTMLWFSAYQLTWRDEAGGVRKGEALIPVDEIGAQLATLPEPLRLTAERQLAAIQSPTQPLTLGERVIRFDQPKVMGILNVTPDSFSDGGKHVDSEAAMAAGFAMSEAGAALVDVGGESTRPGAPLVWEQDEAGRIVPVVERLARGGVAVSVDTRKALVMVQSLGAGAAIINDISALLYDERALDVVRQAGCPVILMHAPSQTSDPHVGADYQDVLFDVYDWLEARVEAVVTAGIDRNRIIVDPGIGFGKSVGDNLALINGTALFHALGCVVLVGASRKRLIGALDKEAPADKRLAGSISLHLTAIERGAQLIRAHDITETLQAIRVWQGLRDTALTQPFADG